MDIFVIQGGRPLEGTVRTAGAKNSCLPILAAALLTEETLELENVPDLSDVRSMLGILEVLGARVERNGSRVALQTRPSSDRSRSAAS